MSSSGVAVDRRGLCSWNVLALGGGRGRVRGAVAERSRRSNVVGVRGRIVLTGDEAESIIECVDEGDLLIGCVVLLSDELLSVSWDRTCRPSRGSGDFGGTPFDELLDWMTDRPLKNVDTCPRIFATRPLLELCGTASGRTKGSCMLDEENRVGMLECLPRRELK
jgi:hypothetical protein